MVPKGVPASVLKRLEQAFKDATSQPEFRTKMEAAGFIVQGLGMADAEKFVDAEAKLMHQLIKEFNIIEPDKK